MSTSLFSPVRSNLFSRHFLSHSRSLARTRSLTQHLSTQALLSPSAVSTLLLLIPKFQPGNQCDGSWPPPTSCNPNAVFLRHSVKWASVRSVISSPV